MDRKTLNPDTGICPVMQEIEGKYMEKEKALEEQILECERLRQESRVGDKLKNLCSLSLSELQARCRKSRARNEELLQEIEKSLAVLRRESTCSPTDEQLERLSATYRSFLQGDDQRT